MEKKAEKGKESLGGKKEREMRINVCTSSQLFVLFSNCQTKKKHFPQNPYRTFVLCSHGCIQYFNMLNV